METWKSVAGFEGFYEVSTLGRVRSLDRSMNTDQFAQFKFALDRHARANAVPAPRRSQYVMSTETRLHAINNGKHVAVPPMDVEMRLTNMTMHQTVVLGHFESAEQAVLFGLTGQIKFGRIPHADILDLVSKSRAGFFQRRLNESEIQHLLSVGWLTFDINRSTHRLVIGPVENEFDMEVEVVA